MDGEEEVTMEAITAAEVMISMAAEVTEVVWAVVMADTVDMISMVEELDTKVAIPEEITTTISTAEETVDLTRTMDTVSTKCTVNLCVVFIYVISSYIVAPFAA